jgi:hypothetical protein
VVDKAYIKKNVADCDRRIKSLARRVGNAKNTGEDVKELRQQIAGYADTRERLLKAS